jgi:hypothetical protein
MVHRTLLPILSLLALAALSGAAFGQVDTATITGVVTDPSGGVIPGAGDRGRQPGHGPGLPASSAKMKSNQFVTEGDSHAAILCIW